MPPMIAPTPAPTPAFGGSPYACLDRLRHGAANRIAAAVDGELIEW
jgi:hypothetical protein